jgi:hypothetical protein
VLTRDLLHEEPDLDRYPERPTRKIVTPDEQRPQSPEAPTLKWPRGLGDLDASRGNWRRRAPLRLDGSASPASHRREAGPPKLAKT